MAGAPDRTSSGLELKELLALIMTHNANFRNLDSLASVGCNCSKVMNWSKLPRMENAWSSSAHDTQCQFASLMTLWKASRETAAR